MRDGESPAAGPAYVLKAPAHRVQPRAMVAWAVTDCLGWLCAAAALIVWISVAPESRDLLQWGVVAAVAGAVVAVAVVTPWRYRTHRWEAGADAVYVQHGWWRRTRVIAPYSRVQTVDSDAGPLYRLLGLGRVRLTTASPVGDIVVSGLDRATVESLVATVTARTIAAAPAEDAT